MDLINRQAVVDEIEYELKMINSALDSMTLDFSARERLRQRRGEAKEILNSVQQLPSAEPERKTGRWILSGIQNKADFDNGNYYYLCSNCQHSDLQAQSVDVPYCWFCGAKMEVKNE